MADEAACFNRNDLFVSHSLIFLKQYFMHGVLLRMQKLAKELGVVIPVSFFEEANNAHYNSVVVIDADGTDLGLYRKSHIPDGPGVQV